LKYKHRLPWFIVYVNQLWWYI